MVREVRFILRHTPMLLALSATAAWASSDVLVQFCAGRQRGSVAGGQMSRSMQGAHTAVSTSCVGS